MGMVLFLNNISTGNVQSSQLAFEELSSEKFKLSHLQSYLIV